MKLKLLLVGFILSIFSLTSSATTYSEQTDGVILNGKNYPTGSFSNISVGKITVTGLSDIVGDFFFESGAHGKNTWVSSTILGGSFASTTFSGNSFSFKNVAAGTYDLFISGQFDTVGKKFDTLITAEYNVSAVPEPKTSGMFLAGLGLIGFIASRRKSSI